MMVQRNSVRAENHCGKIGVFWDRTVDNYDERVNHC